MLRSRGWSMEALCVIVGFNWINALSDAFLGSIERRREGEWNRKPSGPVALTAEEEAILREGIPLELSQWTSITVGTTYIHIKGFTFLSGLGFLIHDQRWWLSDCFCWNSALKHNIKADFFDFSGGFSGQTGGRHDRIISSLESLQRALKSSIFICQKQS